MHVSPNNLEEIIAKVVKELNEATMGDFAPLMAPTSANFGATTLGAGIFTEMNSAIEACAIAQKEFVKLPHAKKGEIADAIKQLAIDKAEQLAKIAHEETGLGNYEDKIIKTKLVGLKTPGIEDLHTESFTGDNGLTLVELSPFGVIGAITPTTNPQETILCNAIGMLAAGNGVVFSPHPSSKKVSATTITLINEVIMYHGGPANLVTTISIPSMDHIETMLKHPKIDMLVATGGPGVVKAVLTSGKKAIGAGAGNPPVVVDETADIEKAAKDIVTGASFDNNILCIAEKEVFVVNQVADYLIFNMQAHGAHLIDNKEDLAKLENLIISNNRPNNSFIGKSATSILSQAGIKHSSGVKLIIVETKKDHIFVQRELMMPVLAIVRASNLQHAIEMAVEAEHGYRHTAIMHSKNVDNLSLFAKAIQTTVFVKNGPSFAGLGVGGEGYVTYTIAGPTGEGLTSTRSFVRKRRCVLVDGFNIR